MAFVRLFDRDPVHYRTGRMFRRLGSAMVRVNPAWTLEISGELVANPRKPYVVVANHQSFADIPLISCLPWEMKWLAKQELFGIPILGWLLKLAGDIPVDRQNRKNAALALLRARWYLQHKCPVIFFPEGTRSPDGEVKEFHQGAFHLAVREGLEILPLAIDGSRNCLPKNSWLFGEPSHVRLAVLPPVTTRNREPDDLAREIREMISGQIKSWRDAERTTSRPVAASGI